MPNGEQFPYVDRDPVLGPASLLPFVPISLELTGHSIDVMGLVDSGASVNVLPYDLGIQLGADWDKQTIRMPLAGNLARLEARALLLTARVGNFNPVSLGFAWSRSNATPVILGQINFFQLFGVCFHRSQSMFEIRPNITG
jgi:hypothetical protein